MVTTNPSQADVICGDPGRCAARINKGEPSPLTGQVLTSTLATELAQRAYGCTRTTEKALTNQARRIEIEVQAREAALQADLEAATKERDLYKDKAMSKVPWYEAPLFVAGTTVVTLVSIFLAVGR